MLQKSGVSYIVAGKSSVNLAKAAHQLRKHFGIRRLLVEGGGHIDGAFLQAGLVDEVSLLLDGRQESFRWCQSLTKKGCSPQAQVGAAPPARLPMASIPRADEEN